MHKPLTGKDVVLTNNVCVSRCFLNGAIFLKSGAPEQVKRTGRPVIRKHIYIYIYTGIITVTASGKRQDHFLAAVLGK